MTFHGPLTGRPRRQTVLGLDAWEARLWHRYRTVADLADASEGYFEDPAAGTPLGRVALPLDALVAELAGIANGESTDDSALPGLADELTRALAQLGQPTAGPRQVSPRHCGPD